MILYDYLFYCSYKMGMRSHNFDGLPVLAGMMMVTPNMMLHLAILQVVLQTLEIHWFEELLALGWWGHIIYLGFLDRKSTRLNSSHITRYRMPSSA